MKEIAETKLKTEQTLYLVVSTVGQVAQPAQTISSAG